MSCPHAGLLSTEGRRRLAHQDGGRHGRGVPVPAAAERQHGAFSRAQALAEGATASTISNRLRRQRWVALLPRVYAEPSKVTPWTRAWAAVLWLPRGVLSGETALWLWDVLPRTDTIHLTATDAPSRARTPTWLRLHRQPITSAERSLALGLPVVCLERALLDCMCSWPARLAAELVDATLASTVSRRALLRSYHSQLGRRGSRQAGRLLAHAAPGAASAPERRLASALRRAGFTRFRRNAPVLQYRADLLDPDLRLIIEVDGWSAHGDRISFQHDRTRQNDLVRHGYVVLRFNATEVLHRLPDVVAEIGSMVERLEARRLP